MKAYEIWDQEDDRFVGILCYFEKEHSFVIELSEELNEWSAPLLFANLVRKKKYTVPRKISLLWVRERVIPIGRQNIKSILRNHRLKEYDELKFLELSEGRCSQDSLYIRKITNLPEFVKERMKRNLAECVVCEGPSLLCFFNDGKIRKTDLTDLTDSDHIDKILYNRKLLESGKIAAGGYFVTFNDSIDIPAADLYDRGLDIPLQMCDFTAFVRKNVLDTGESCLLLECSRQNLAYMVRQGQLAPLRENVRGNLYLKGDVLRSRG